VQKYSDIFSGSHSFHCVRRLHCVLTKCYIDHKCRFYCWWRDWRSI